MEEEKISSWWSQLPGKIHVVDGVGFLLDIPALGDLGAEDFGSRRRSFILGLLRLVIIEIMLPLVEYLLIDVADGVGEGV